MKKRGMELIFVLAFISVFVAMAARSKNPQTDMTGASWPMPDMGGIVNMKMPPAFPESTPELLALGKNIYGGYCVQCHGPEGNGEMVGCHASCEEKPLQDPALYHHDPSPQGIFDLVTYGEEDTAMAPFDGVLNSDELVAVTLYVCSLQKAARRKTR